VPSETYPGMKILPLEKMQSYTQNTNNNTSSTLRSLLPLIRRTREREMRELKPKLRESLSPQKNKK
jgi:hypothetical protein